MNKEDWARRELEDNPYEFQPTNPFWRSKADPARLEAIFEKARRDGFEYRFQHENPRRLTRGELADMEKTIRDARAELRTLNSLYGTINQAAAE